MSIAVIKKRGSEIPENEKLLKCWQLTMSDGSSIGYAFCRKNKLYIRRGYAYYSTFKAEITRDNITKDDSLFIFFRESKTPYYKCHKSQPLCLPLNKKEYISKSDVKHVFMHCGKIEYKKTRDLTVTDSMIFASNIIDSLSNPNSEYSESIEGIIGRYFFSDKDIVCKKVVNQILGDNKFAFMDNNGRIDLFGKWTLRNGIIYSKPID